MDVIGSETGLPVLIYDHRGIIEDVTEKKREEQLHLARDTDEAANQAKSEFLSILNDILGYAKVEAGKLNLEQINFDLRVTLDDINDLLAIKALQLWPILAGPW